MNSNQIGNLKSNDKDNLHSYMNISLKEEIAYNKILVPFDSSKPSETSLKHAIKIAEMSVISSANSPVSVILLHVIQQIPVPYTFGFSSFKSSKTGNMVNLEQYLKDITLEIKADVEKIFKEKVEKYKKIENLSLQLQVLIGDPSDEIIKFANDEKVELIIMGTTGLTGNKKDHSNW